MWRASSSKTTRRLKATLKLAESEAGRAQDALEFTKQRLAKIKEVSKGTAAEVAVEYSYEDRVLDAERREPKARLAREQAQFKLKFLREHTKPRRVKELQAEVEKLRADELAKKAVWESEKAKERRLEAQIASSDRNVSAVQGVEALKRAFGIDEKIRDEMAKIAKSVTIDQAHAKTITDLLDELERVGRSGGGPGRRSTGRSYEGSDQTGVRCTREAQAMIHVRTQTIPQALRNGVAMLLRVTMAAGAVALAGLWMAQATPVASGRNTDARGGRSGSNSG